VGTVKGALGFKIKLVGLLRKKYCRALVPGTKENVKILGRDNLYGAGYAHLAAKNRGEKKHYETKKYYAFF
jgi:hypothetical protein